MRTRRLALMALLTAVALVIFVAESQIPPIVPLPGVKLGLANIITLVAMKLLGRRDSGLVLITRIIMGSIFAGGVSAMLFSLAGGVLAYAVMCLTINRFEERLLWVISVLSAIAHNLGQITVAVLVTGTPALFVYFPALVVSAIITGVFTGMAAMYLLKRLKLF